MVAADCRSVTLVHLDHLVFALFFARSLMFSFWDIAACFVFFYMWFVFMHATKADACENDAIEHAALRYINETLIDCT